MTTFSDEGPNADRSAAFYDEVQSRPACPIKTAISNFEKTVGGPLAAVVSARPNDVLAATAELRRKLDALDGVANMLPKVEPVAIASPGTEQPHSFELASPSSEAAELSSDLGRNQRSKIRELVILDLMDRVDRPCTLTELMSELAAFGLSDSQSAVVSHLHRLKDQDVISVPGSGTYRLDATGLGHLKTLRRNFGALKPARKK